MRLRVCAPISSISEEIPIFGLGKRPLEGQLQIIKAPCRRESSSVHIPVFQPFANTLQSEASNVLV